MEKGIPRQGMHVAAYDIRTDRFTGFGTIIKPNQPLGIRSRGETVKTTMSIMKLVRHGKVRVVTGEECYWVEKGSNDNDNLRSFL